MPRTNEPTTDGQNIQAFSAHARKIFQPARLHANNLLRSVDELEKLINPVIDSALFLSTDHTNAQYNNGLEIMESEWKIKLKQSTDNVDKCIEVVDSVSQLQQLDLKAAGRDSDSSSSIPPLSASNTFVPITTEPTHSRHTSISTPQEKDATTQGQS